LRTIRLVYGLMILFAVAPFCKDSKAEANLWQMLDEGLYLGRFSSTLKSRISNFPITILKINPEFYSFKLLCASEHDGNMRTAKQWCNEFGLLAAINASMYQDTDPLKSTGYMKNYKHINNPHINPAFGAFMAFNPIDSSLPESRFVDRRLHKDWKAQIEKYHTVVQNYCMISKGKRKGWPQQKKLCSTAAVGMDNDNNVLFIFSPSPYSTHDFIHILLSLPIDIDSAMYLEGGPEATLYISPKDIQTKREGRYGSVFGENFSDLSTLTLPNVIGIVKRK
jgi:hypothetical protein